MNEENYTYDEYDDDYYYEEDDSVLDEVEEYSNYQNDDYNYNDGDDDDKSSVIRGRVIKAIIIIFVVGLVVFTGSRLLSGKNKTKDDIDVATKVENKKINIDNDIENIKSSVLSYYTAENVPTTIGNDSLLTLNDLNKNNILPKLSSSSYDNEKSYAKLTKKEDKYILEVSLKAKETSKTKTYEVNNYSYCINAYLCLMDEELENSLNESPVDIDITSNEDDTALDDDTENNDNSGTQDYLYKYIKNSSNKKLSEWSLWNKYQRTPCTTPSKTCDSNDMNCLEEVKLYQRKERIGSYPRVYTTTKNSIKQTKLNKKQTCNKHDYIKINNNYYQAPLNSNYQDITKITSNTRSSYGNFIYNGRKVYQTPPTDTINTYYIFVGIDNANCGDNCNTLPKYIYDSYTFNKTLKPVDGLKGCNKLANSVVPSYIISPVAVSVTREEGLYGTVCYSSTRTRSILTSNNSDVKWSYYNDKSLLDAGYIYSGETK